MRILEDRLGFPLFERKVNWLAVTHASRAYKACCPYRKSNSDVLVVETAKSLGYTKPALEITENDWSKLFDLQVKKHFFFSQMVGKIMIAHSYGKTGSTGAASTNFAKGFYGMSKAVISQMMAALSTEWTPKGVRGNAIAPTVPFTSSAEYIKTRDPEHLNRLLSRIKLGRFAKPEDNFDAALFLASPASDFVSGQTLFVDGGWNAV